MTREFSFSTSVYGDGKPLLMESKSSGNALGLQSFPLEEPTLLRKMTTVFGQGNSMNTWNSITELMVCGDERNALEQHHVDVEEDECNTFELESIVGRRKPCLQSLRERPQDALELRRIPM